MIVKPGETFRIIQEVVYDGYVLGTSSGQFPGGEYQIRDKDGLYFNGSTYVQNEVWLPSTISDNELSHYFDITIPGIGSTTTTFNIKIRPINDKVAETQGTLTLIPQEVQGGNGQVVIRADFNGIFDWE